MAGSRFPHLPAKIPFGYNELTNALANAIEQSGKEDGAIIVDHQENRVDETRSYDEVSAEAKKLWAELIEKDPNNKNRIMKIVEKVFGHSIKLSEITDDQIDLYELVVLEMKAL